MPESGKPPRQFLATKSIVVVMTLLIVFAIVFVRGMVNGPVESPTTSHDRSDVTSSSHSDDVSRNRPRQGMESGEPTSDTQKFVGNQVCRECHLDHAESFAGTGHAHALGSNESFPDHPDGQFEHTRTGRKYVSYHRGTELRHAEQIETAAGELVTLADYRVQFVIGSGNHTHSYLIDDDGYYIESPITWFSSRNEWGISPGYEHNNTGFSRAVHFECIFCHSGRVAALNGNRARINIESFTIDCERCHGPGGSHVKFRSAAAKTGTKGRDPIVNPAHLDRERSESICSQCHLRGDATVELASKRLSDFRPGMRFREVQLHYGLQSEDSSMSLTGHVVQLHRSRCYQSAESMTCTTCHDPHFKPSAEDRVSYFREKCLSCHSEKGCKSPKEDRIAKSSVDDCISCHMPATPSEIAHVAVTHHRVGIHAKNESATSARPVQGELVALADMSDVSSDEQERYLGLAYLDLSTKESQPAASRKYQQRSRELLEHYLQHNPWDVELGTALASTYQRQDTQRCIEMANRVLKSDALSTDVRVKALFALSDSYVATNNFREAIPVLEQLTSLRRQGADWFVLGVCRYQLKDIQGGLEAAQRAVAIRPDQPKYQLLVAELYSLTGQEALAKKHQDIAKALSAALQGPNQPRR